MDELKTLVNLLDGYRDNRFYILSAKFCPATERDEGKWILEVCKAKPETEDKNDNNK